MIAKSEIPNIFVACVCVFFCAQHATAQFHTITKDSPVTAEMHKASMQIVENKNNAEPHMDNPLQNAVKRTVKHGNEVKAHSVTGSKSQRRNIRGTDSLPELTVPNLIEEIKLNGIKYPKIVLAQAILETGWFKSSVCRKSITFSASPIRGQANTMSSRTGRRA